MNVNQLNISLPRLKDKFGQDQAHILMLQEALEQAQKENQEKDQEIERLKAQLENNNE